jgi:NAD-dependent dihydropyrimidine dehydrogenase PreA subunit/coenzyme F420-reducing hydrogenase delta subunit
LPAEAIGSAQQPRGAMTRAYVNRPRAARLLERVLWPLDRFFDRLYGSAYNPFYHSGALAFWLLIVVTVTGVYLLLFYRVSAPYASLEAIQGQAWAGRWIRTLHRYASDAAIAAIAFHTLRMMAQGRTWGPRMLAWVSGVILLGFTLVCGWTGFVMMWDVQAQLIVLEFSRTVDVLPLFTEPISRTFVGGVAPGGAFFFINLWLHVSLPLLIVLFLWIHTIRAARPQLTPPRRLLWAVAGLLTALSVAWPAALPPPADLLAEPGRVPVDWFYGFWVPLARAVGPWPHLLAWVAFWLLGFALPWWWRPARKVRGEPALADETVCTGCGQCYQDCPYEAISMVPRLAGKGSDLVAHVTAERCVSCGICAGSCAPMVIGPPGRAGRDQLREVQVLRHRGGLGPDRVVVFACRNGIGAPPAIGRLERVELLPVNCGGELHSSAIEYLVRSGVGGVMVMACPERNCVHREGPRWLFGRLYEEREAELKPRVDRSRVRLCHYGAGDWRAARHELLAFQAEVLARVHEAHAEPEVELDLECEPMPLDEVRHG